MISIYVPQDRPGPAAIRKSATSSAWHEPSRHREDLRHHLANVGIGEIEADIARNRVSGRADDRRLAVASIGHLRWRQGIRGTDVAVDARRGGVTAMRQRGQSRDRGR
jgi:hypothetical protein